jgi:hypothetical protein
MDNSLKYVKLNNAPSHLVSKTLPIDPTIKSNTGYFGMTQEYFNGFSKPIYIVTREGLQLEIPPIANPSLRELVIRYTLTMGKDVNFNIDGLLNSSVASSQILAQILREGGSMVRFGQRIFSLDYYIGVDEVQAKGGSIYLNNLDCVISILNGHLIPHHPYSEAYQRNLLVEQYDHVNSSNSFGYGLKIIDNLKAFGVRFVNVNGQVYRIPVIDDSILPDGVYLTSSGPVDSDIPLVKPISKRYSFEEADTALRLYKTIEAAKSLGDEFGEKEKELRRLTLQIKEREQELKSEKLAKEAEFEIFKQNIERQRLEEDKIRKQEENVVAQRLTQLKEEMAQLEHKRTLDMLKQKEYFESRSLDRKDSSETIKFLPTLITGALALFLAFARV